MSARVSIRKMYDPSRCESSIYRREYIKYAEKAAIDYVAAREKWTVVSYGNSDYRYDAIVETVFGTRLKVEVKYSSFENGVYIEVANGRGEPTGLSTTEADVYIIVNIGYGKTVHGTSKMVREGKVRVIHTNILTREMLKSTEFTVREADEISPGAKSFWLPLSRKTLQLSKDEEGYVGCIPVEVHSSDTTYIFPGSDWDESMGLDHLQ